MPTVTVPAIANFQYQGRQYSHGDPVTCRPIEALALARRRHVSLSPSYARELTRVCAVIEPDVVKVELAPMPEPAPSTTGRRRGRPRKPKAT